MRELKFRAWDRIRERMSCPFYIQDITIMNCTVVFREAINLWFNLNSVDCEIMQYTGLHDKNGKEIYEGDIVLNQWGEEWQVIFDNNLLMYSLKYNESKRPLYQATQNHDWRLEIIGNIWENPELLEDEK